MIDERQRELERQAKLGDPVAAEALARSRRRTATCAGTVHDAEDIMTDDERRLANAHDAAAERDKNVVGLLKKCEMCGLLVRLRGSER